MKMKKLLLFLMLLSAISMSAQDVIVKKNGSTIVCRVVELTSTEIVYKRWSDLNGSNYVMNRTDVTAINYENGKRVNLQEAVPNLYLPNNQNDGIQQLNDRALLAIDQASHYKPRKAKALQLIGWIGGIAIIGGGIAFACTDDDNTPIGLGIAGGGALFTAGFLYAASRQSRDSMVSIELYKHDFKFDNGSLLSAGIDMLSDQVVGSKSLGLGLHYNF